MPHDDGGSGHHPSPTGGSGRMLAGIAARREAAAGARFSIRRQLPAFSHDQPVEAIGFHMAQYTGFRRRSRDLIPFRDKDTLRDALADVVRSCIIEDGAEAVIWGGPWASRARPAAVLRPIPDCHAVRSILADLRQQHVHTSGDSLTQSACGGRTRIRTLDPLIKSRRTALFRQWLGGQEPLIYRAFLFGGVRACSRVSSARCAQIAPKNGPADTLN